MKAIFNMKNFGQFNSPYYGLCQTTGACTVLLCCDFQDPVEMIHWQEFALGSAPILIGVFFLGGVQLFFIGLLGEYIMSMNTRIMNRPLVIEEERLNFDEKEQTAEASSSQSVHPEPIM